MRSCTNVLGILLTLWATEAAFGQEVVLTRLPTSGGPVIGRPRSLALGAGDRVFVGEEGPALVLSFDSLGRYLRAIGREGSGPGEFRIPVVGAGAVLVVHDPALTRLTVFDLSGRILRSGPGPCCRAGPIRVANDGRTFALSSPLVMGGGPSRDELVVFNASGTPVDSLQVPAAHSDAQREWRLNSPEAAVSYPVPFQSRPWYTVTRTGSLVWGHSSAARLTSGSSLGAPAIHVTLSGAPVRLALADRQAARQSAIDEMSRMIDRRALEAAFRLGDVPEVAPAFFGLDVDACDRWWVLRTPPFVAGPTQFDVFSATGAPMGTVRIPERLLGPGSFWAVGARRLAAVIDDGDGAPTVGLYRLPERLACGR